MNPWIKRCAALLCVLAMLLGAVPITLIAGAEGADCFYCTADVVEFASLKDGDEIAIVVTADPAMTGKDYVLLNNFGANPANNAVVFTGVFDESMTWTVKIVDGEVFLINGVIGLSVDNLNNGLRANSVAMAITMDASGYLSMIDPVGDVRYIGIYDNNAGDTTVVKTPNFRSYRSYENNTKNQITTIYRIQSHEWGKEITATEPTCTEPGTKTYRCTLCGAEKTDAIPALGHARDQGVISKEPSCAEGGLITYTCVVCGEQEDEIIPANEKHSYEDGICTVCGSMDYSTSGCFKYIRVNELLDGDRVVIYNAGSGMAVSNRMNSYGAEGAVLTVDGEEIFPLDDAVIWTVEINDDGTYTFTNMGMELGANYDGVRVNLILEPGHNNKWELTPCNEENMSFFVTNSEVVCQREGVYLEWYKDRFSVYDTFAEKVTEEYYGFQFFAGFDYGFCDHIWGGEQVITPASCTTEGEIRYICDFCESSKVERIPALEHAWDQGVVSKEPSCAERGLITYTCVVCGEQEDEIIPANEKHSYEDGICTVCGHMDSINDCLRFFRVNELLDGDRVVIYNAGSGMAVANRMNGYYVEGVEVEVNGEALFPWDDAVIWTVDINDDGTYTFTNMGMELGVDYNGTFAYLYIDPGYKNKWELTPCNEENMSFFITNPEITGRYERVYLEWYKAKGGFNAYDTTAAKATEEFFGFQFFVETDYRPCNHIWGGEQVITPASCTTEGKIRYICDFCESSKVERIPALGHNFEDWSLSIVPTCTTDGLKIWACSVCGAEGEQEVVPAKGHSYTDDLCVCGLNRSLQLQHTLNLASDISISYVIRKTLVQDCTDLYLECKIPEYEGNALTGSHTQRIEAVDRGEYYYFTLEGLTAVNMNDEIESVLYMHREGKTVFTNADVYSIATYAYRRLNDENTTENMKVLCANLLRYGASAQSFKGYRTDALPDAAMTDRQRAYLTDLETVAFGNNNMVLEDNDYPLVAWAGRTLDLQSKVGVTFVVALSMYPGNPENMTLRINYKTNDGTIITETLSNPRLYNEELGFYAFTFNGLMAAELRTVITAAVFAGQTQLSHTLIYSPDTYGNGKTGDLLTLCQSLFAYSDAAKVYFGG